MRLFNLKLPSREELERNRFIRPFAHFVASPLVWHFHRRNVARGVALGIFLGFILPMGLQTPVAAIFALGARANLPSAVVATLVTNPLTFPFVYMGAFAVGRLFLPGAPLAADAAASFSGFSLSADSLVAVIGPTYLGLLIFAVLGSILGFLAVHFLWRRWVARRRTNRIASRPARSRIAQPAT